MTPLVPNASAYGYLSSSSLIGEDVDCFHFLRSYYIFIEYQRLLLIAQLSLATMEGQLAIMALPTEVIMR